MFQWSNSYVPRQNGRSHRSVSGTYQWPHCCVRRQNGRSQWSSCFAPMGHISNQTAVSQDKMVCPCSQTALSQWDISVITLLCLGVHIAMSQLWNCCIPRQNGTSQGSQLLCPNGTYMYQWSKCNVLVFTSLCPSNGTAMSQDKMVCPSVQIALSHVWSSF